MTSAVPPALQAHKLYDKALAPLLQSHAGDEAANLYMLLEYLMCYAMLLYLTKGWVEGVHLFEQVVKADTIAAGVSVRPRFPIQCGVGQVALLKQ